MRSNQPQPVVLLLAASEWTSTARLAMSLAALGCRVELVGAQRHPALSTRAISKRYPYNPLRPLPGLRRAILNSGAGSVIAVDEVMVLHLEELWNAEPDDSSLRRLLGQSTGGPQVLEAARSRMKLLTVATAAGVAVPETLAIDSPAALRQAMQTLATPTVLKSDASSGGRGVRVLNTPSEVSDTWQALHNPPSLLRALKRGFERHEWTHLRPWAQRQTRGVTAQKFVQGTERTAMAVCKEGVVLACVCLEVVMVWSLRGPSSVLRVIEDAVMHSAVAGVASSLGITGFCGFDFIVDPATEQPLLIEMNPRPTQLAHLPLGAGRDLVAMYVREMVGLPQVADRAAATDKDLIALFPQELQRCPESEMIRSAYHDVPWEEPALIQRVLKPIPAILTSDLRWKTAREAALSAHNSSRNKVLVRQ